MSRKPDPELRRWWCNLHAQFDPQRHSVVQFCRAHDVSVASFYQWRKRLAGTTSPRLIPVQVLEHAVQTQRQQHPGRTAAVVRIGSQTIIEIADHQAERLTEIIIALARLQHADDPSAREGGLQ